MYREIVMFCGKRSRIEKALRMIEKGGKYYELSAFNDLPEDSPPRSSFLIFDGEEVFLGRLAIRHAEVARYFIQQYDDLWKKAIPVKAGGNVNFEFIENAKRPSK